MEEAENRYGMIEKKTIDEGMCDEVLAYIHSDEFMNRTRDVSKQLELMED